MAGKSQPLQQGGQEIPSHYSSKGREDVAITARNAEKGHPLTHLRKDWPSHYSMDNMEGKDTIAGR